MPLEVLNELKAPQDCGCPHFEPFECYNLQNLNINDIAEQGGLNNFHIELEKEVGQEICNCSCHFENIPEDYFIDLGGEG